MKTKFTPGPWEAVQNNDGHEIQMGTSLRNKARYEPQHIVEYDHNLNYDDGNQFIEADANARLIAAAPDLFDTLEMALRVCRATYGKEFEEWAEYKRATEVIEKVIG